MRPVREVLGRVRAADLNETRIDRDIKERLDAGRKPSTVNRETQLLGQAFRLAATRRWVNHLPHIRRLPERNARQGFFEVEEIEAVIAHLPHYLKGFVRFGYLSGWGKGEIAGLTWDDVDHNARIIRLRPEGSKTGEGRVLALSGELWEVIEQRYQERGSIPWVFHRKEFPIGDIRKAWKTACRKAEVPGKLFHDLRRTAVRDMVRAGVPERIAMAISGHTTRSIFDRYNIVSEADLREAVDRTQTYRQARTGMSKQKK